MSADRFRAEFDATVVFSNGGGLQVQAFRVDVPGPDATSDQIATLFIASMNLLMVDRVDLANLRVFAEAHKGTHRGPSDLTDMPDAIGTDRTWVELSHVISDGMITYPGLPAPTIAAHLTREDSRSLYAAGTEFEIDQISMIGNTGTYLDSPYHRYEGGADLLAADIPIVEHLHGPGLRLSTSPSALILSPPDRRRPHWLARRDLTTRRLPRADHQQHRTLSLALSEAQRQWLIIAAKALHAASRTHPCTALTRAPSRHG